MFVVVTPIPKYDACMTKLLQQAFTKASELPESEQDAIASLMLAELQSEQRWAQSFAATGDQLSSWADEALAEFEAGETLPLDIDRDFPHD
jgi:hypothetical protein